MPFRIIIILTTLLIVGCSDLAKLQGSDIQYRVENISDSHLDNDLSLLIQRLDSVSPSIFSTAGISEVDGQRIITFYGDSPTDEQIKYLSQNKGHLKLIDDNNNVWFTHQDIKASDVTVEKTSPYAVDGELFLRDEFAYVDLSINEASAKKVEVFSSNNRGIMVNMMLDDKNILRASINDTISSNMRVSVDSEDMAKKIVALLQHGPLSQSIHLKQITAQPVND